MSRIKKILILAVTLIIVGVIGCLATYQQANTTVTLTKEKTINALFSKVHLDTDNAKVIVLPTKDNQARVILSGKKAKDINIRFDMYVKDNTLYVQFKEKRKLLFHFDFLTEVPTVRVYLPEKQYDVIKVENNNGKIQLKTLKTNNLVTTTDNGLIELNDINSKKVTAKTDNGKIIIDHVTGDLHASTDNGEIIVMTKDLDRHMQLSCENGKITVHSDSPPTNVRFLTNIDNGSINILDHRYQNGDSVGQGKNVIILSTDNGSIKVTD